MTKHQTHIHFKEYGTLNTAIEKLKSDTSILLESRKKKYSSINRPIVTPSQPKRKRTVEFARTKIRSVSTQRGSSLQGRIKRTIDKIYKTAEESREQEDFDAYDDLSDIHIRLPSTTSSELQIPHEVKKTILALILLIINFIINLTALAIIHEFVPDRTIYEPLPDIFISNVPAQDWAMDVSEYLIMVTCASTMLILSFHRYRSIVFRRIFLIMALLYFMRSVTISVTILPVASKTYVCSPKENNTSFMIIAMRVVNMMSGLGLSINGKHVYCGDYMFSGHTVTLVMCWLLISEYTPKMYFLVHWLYGIVAFLGVLMILIAHGHYTLDVLAGYFITTRIFWTYHTLANNNSLKKKHEYNYYSKTWTFGVFQYFEANVNAPLPCQYQWPKKFSKR